MHWLEEYHDELLVQARKLTRDPDDAKDLFGETALKALTGKFTGGNRRAWLYRIMRNAWINEYRRRRKYPAEQLTDYDVLVGSTDIEGSAMLRESCNEIAAELYQLPEKQRRSLVMYAVGGLEYTRIAELEGVAVGTVKSLVHRARGRIGHVLG